MDAAEALLETHNVSDLTIDLVMARTELARTNFYRLFEDLDALLLEILERAKYELETRVTAWSEGTGPVEEALGIAVRGVVTAYAHHGVVFRAIGEGAAQAPRLRAAWRGFVDDFTEATIRRIERDVRAGYTRVENAGETACALVLMTEAYMRRAVEDGDLDPERAAATLVPIWTRALTERDVAGTP